MNNCHRILITGATGFIGSRLTRFFVDNGYVVAIIKRNNSNCERIQDLLEKLDIFNYDISDGKNIAEVFDKFKPNIVIHMATFYSLEHHYAEINNMYETNVLGMINLLEASKNKVDLFINTSTCFIYDNKDKPLVESDRLNPLNLYALTKIQSEEASSFYYSKYGLKTITLRLFPPFGPGDNQRRLIPFLLDKIFTLSKVSMNTGKQMWDFVFIDDIVNAYYQIICKMSKIKPGDIFNISTGNPIPIKKVCELILELTNSETELIWGKNPHRENEIWYLSGSYNKINNCIGWEPKYTLLNGLRETIDWFNQNHKKK